MYVWPDVRANDYACDKTITANISTDTQTHVAHKYRQLIKWIRFIHRNPRNAWIYQLCVLRRYLDPIAIGKMEGMGFRENENVSLCANGCASTLNVAMRIIDVRRRKIGLKSIGIAAKKIKQIPVSPPM